MINPKTIILLGLGLLFVVLAIRSLRRQHVKERYAILFCFVGLPFLVLALWQDAVVRLADLLRTDYRTLQILCLGAFSLLMIFKLLSIVSVQDRKITALSQMVGILAERQGLGAGKAGGSGDGEKTGDKRT